MFQKAPTFWEGFHSQLQCLNQVSNYLNQCDSSTITIVNTFPMIRMSSTPHPSRNHLQLAQRHLFFSIFNKVCKFCEDTYWQDNYHFPYLYFFGSVYVRSTWQEQWSFMSWVYFDFSFPVSHLCDLGRKVELEEGKMYVGNRVFG